MSQKAARILNSPVSSKLLTPTGSRCRTAFFEALFLKHFGPRTLCKVKNDWDYRALCLDTILLILAMLKIPSDKLKMYVYWYISNSNNKHLYVKLGDRFWMKTLSVFQTLIENMTLSTHLEITLLSSFKKSA